MPQVVEAVQEVQEDLVVVGVVIQDITMNPALVILLQQIQLKVNQEVLQQVQGLFLYQLEYVQAQVVEAQVVLEVVGQVQEELELMVELE